MCTSTCCGVDFTHLVPVDVSQKQDPALWRARFWRRGRRNWGLRGLWQGDVPRGVDVKFATGRAHEQGARLGGPQQGLLQGPDEVVPEQLGDLSTDKLVGQVETNAGLSHRICHSLFIQVVLGEVTRQSGMRGGVTIKKKGPNSP